MKHFLLLAFLPFLGFGQDTLQDDFSDGNFSQNLHWEGEDSLFSVNSTFELQLNANSSGESYLSTRSEISQKAKWRFKINLGFNPSSSNYAKVYLTSDQKDLKNAVNGYFIRIGGSSQDKLSLYKQTGNSILLLAESPASYLNSSSVNLDVLVERDSNSFWKLSADTGYVANNLVFFGSAFDSSHISSSYFGINCKYTSTRSKLFFFDDLNIVGYPYFDQEKPKLDTIVQVYKNSIQLVFNENVTKTSVENIQNYYLDQGLGFPILAKQDLQNKRKVNLTFSNEFYYNKVYTIILYGIEDAAGNKLFDTLDFQFIGEFPYLSYYDFINKNTLLLKYTNEIFKNNAEHVSNYLNNIGLTIDSVEVSLWNKDYSVLLYFKDSIPLNQNIYLNILNQQDTMGYNFAVKFWFCRREWQVNDLLINEIMADPSPVVGIFPKQLPESEYVEIYNRSNFYVNLKNWMFIINEDSVDLGYFNLPPQNYLVFVKDENKELFMDSISILGLNISSTSLINSGGSLKVVSKSRRLINTVDYTGDWYSGSGKENGGWSLERRDIYRNCNGAVNWSPSENGIGGTPGSLNSVSEEITDTVAPEISSISLNGDSVLVIEWTKELDGSNFNKSNLSIVPEMEIYDALLHKGKSLKIKFIEKLEPHIIYFLKWRIAPEDCFGNGVRVDSVPFALPFMPANSEVLINELLFNPYPGGSDFVELYNNSEKVFDLSKMRIGNWNHTLNMIENVSTISNETKLFFPKTYLVLSEDVNSVKENYYHPYGSRFLEVSNLPSFPDKEGSVSMINSQYEVLDFMVYNEESHSVFLNEQEGVSLERLSTSPLETKWFSASSSVGFASPGYKNSQLLPSGNGSGIHVAPKVFSPNLDGYNDLLKIELNFPYMGYVVDLSVWNSVGKRVRVITKNSVVSSFESFFWEGENDLNMALPAGVYIILARAIHPNGENTILKETCILSR